MCVGAGQQAGERYPLRVGDQVVLAAELAPINRAGAGFLAPKKRAQLSRVADSAREIEATIAATLGEQTLVQCLEDTCRSHSSKRRQQVMPEP